MFWNKEKDPVCGMRVDKDTQFKSTHKGKTYYFCAMNCKQDFDKNPGRYVR